MSRLEALYARAARAAVPVEVMLELTHHCNFRCRHCYIPDFLVPDALSTERVLELLEELAEMGTLVVALSGGEIFLRRDWHPIAARARELGFELHLFSNAFLVDEGTADAIAGLEATMQVSLYTMEADRFDAIVRRPGAFTRVVEGIERLRERDVRVILKVPLMTLNRGSLPAIQAYAASIGAECRSSPIITARKDGDTTPLGLRLAPAEAFGELGGPLAIGCFPERDPDGPLCAAASRYCCITTTGDVMACNILPGSGGNVRERPFREIWERSPWLREVRGIRAQDLAECGSCSRLSYCGRCHAQALVEDGSLYGPSTHARLRAELVESRDELAAGS
jgi:radical SAM protein with 4Fe4S-binding SPASM domain